MFKLKINENMVVLDTCGPVLKTTYLNQKKSCPVHVFRRVN